MNQLKRKYYLAEIVKIKRGNSNGRFINAKPYFVLSLIEAIEENCLKENKIFYPNVILENIYLKIFREYEPKATPSPWILPLLHLRGESFYNIKWKGIPFVSSSKAHSASGKFLKENFDYSYVDTDLWVLLQDSSFRVEMKQMIINFFLKG